MRIGIFGGTFDPIHLGHINLIKTSTKLFGLKKVIVLPNLNPYYKENSAKNFEHVNNMINMSLKLDCDFEISDIEKDPEKKHYSYNSLKEIIFLNGNHKYYFFLGSDTSLDFKKWYKYSDLLNLVNVVFISRPKFKFSSDFIDDKVYSRKLNYRGMLIYYNHLTKKKIIRFPLKKEIDISSKELRLMLKSLDENKVKRFLNNEVYDYIIKNKLYF
jgi:nicotinate-nucleotide adenylyltransferase